VKNVYPAHDKKKISSFKEATSKIKINTPSKSG
jgi:hypothetical protein